jgi:phosphocarrier protein
MPTPGSASKENMKQAKIVIPWEEGLHLRPASRVVKLAQTCRSTVWIRANEKVANAKSIMGILLLCASFGTVLELEASGDDEDQALTAIQALFEPADTAREGRPGNATRITA